MSNQEQTIKNTYLEMELVYIEKIELLRCEKNKCEAIKSNAMKNLNAQKDIHMTEMNIKLQSIANNKESFEQIEQVEGNKKILEFRLNRDIDNAQIEYEINELERELKKIEFLRKKDKHHLKLEQQLQLDLLEINLEYQNKVLENRRNFSNISKMLEIQKNGLVKNFFNDISYQKIDYELAKYNFFNECDNLQYKIYKLEYDYQSKLLDEETNTAIKVAESKKQNVDSLSVHEEKIAQNYSLYRECMERISFYKERFNIEKKMIFDARNLFKATLKIIIGIENIVCKLLNSISKEYATRNYNVLSCLFEYIRDMKLSAITALFSNEIKVISTRIDFDKDLKYSRVIKALNEERDSYLKQLYDRYDKIEETINNYNSGIKIFEKNLANIKTEVEHYFIEIKHLSKNKDKASEMKILSLKKQINENDNKIKNIKIQINTNRLNIHNLEFSKFSIQREINKTNTKYEKQFNNIIRSQNKDAKIYNKTIQIIKRQYNQLKTVCIKQSYCFSKFKLTNLEILFNKLELSNSKIWELTKYYSELNTNSFNNAVSQELHSLNLNYHDSYERNDNQIYAAKIIDTNISKNRINEIIKTHNVKVLQLQKDHDEELNKLYTELNQLTSTHLKLTHQYDNQMKRAKLKHQHIVSCQQENYQKYEENYTDNTNNYREIFQQSNKDKKRKFKKNVEDLNQKLIAYEKNDHTRSTSNVLIKKNQIHDLKVIYQENLQKYNMQIKAINDKYHNLQVETNKLIKKNTESNYKNQKANRQEFELQIKLIEQRSRQKIIENQKKYLKKQQKK